MAKKPPKFEALVVNAIRRLQATQGSTETEIANFLSQEYNVAGPEVRKHIQLTLRRGMNYGILHKSKRGYVTCDRNTPDVLDVAQSSRKRRSRRGGRGKSSRRGRSRSKLRTRAACSSCLARRRALTNAGVRARRRAPRRVPPRLAKGRSKTKKFSSRSSNKNKNNSNNNDDDDNNKNKNDDATSNRQQTSNRRPNSKTPVRGGNDGEENRSSKR